MLKIFLPIISLVSLGYSVDCGDDNDVCVSIQCSPTDSNVVYSSLGTSENRVYLKLTSFQGTATACAFQNITEHDTPLSPLTTATSQGTSKPEIPIDAETTGYTGPFGSNYYWRTFVGKIPFDAIPVGTDVTGQTTYFGSGYYTYGGVVPGTVKEGDENVYSHMGDVLYTTTISAKILCSPLGQRPQWKIVSMNDLNSLTDCHAIREGAYNGPPFYVARVFHNGRYVEGKVFPPDHMYAGMEIWDDEIVKYEENFEILAYCKTE